MDSKDYRIIVSETFDRIEASLRRHAVEGVEASSDGSRLILQAHDMREIAFESDPAAQRLLATFDDAPPARFYYHDIEERWFDERTEEPFSIGLGRMLASLTRIPITIPTEDLP
jgi:hypothetical protein